MGIWTPKRRTLRRKLLLVGLAFVTPITVVPQPVSSLVVPKWSRFEQSFKSSTVYSNPLKEITLTVLFTSPSGISNEVYGFWDGGKTWRARFSPDQVGRWAFRTICSDSSNHGLHNHTGEFVCTAPTTTSRFSQHGPVRLARDHRHFEHSDGTPFFWLADTVGDIALTGELKDWQFYAATRVRQDFTVAQWVVGGAKDLKNETAFTSGPQAFTVNPHFFQRLDAKLEVLSRAGILSAITPSLERKMDNQSSTILPADQSALLLKYIIARWGADPVAWILTAENRQPGGNLKHWQTLGQTLFGVGPRESLVLVASEASGLLEDFRPATWVDAFAFQPVADLDDQTLRSSLKSPHAQKWNREPLRPLIAIAPCENGLGSQSKKRFTADDLRRATYWGLLLTPSVGITYCALGVRVWDKAKTLDTPKDLPMWQKSLFLPGASQMSHLTKFMNSIEFWRLRPRPQIVATQPGDTTPRRYIAAAATEARDLTLVYVPEDRTVEILLDALPPAPNITWFNPRTGQANPAVAVVSANTCQFPTPDSGDWLLVMKAGK